MCNIKYILFGLYSHLIYKKVGNNAVCVLLAAWHLTNSLHSVAKEQLYMSMSTCKDRRC